MQELLLLRVEVLALARILVSLAFDLLDGLSLLIDDVEVFIEQGAVEVLD